MVEKNMFKIKGVIFAKPVRVVPDTKNKNGGKPYEFGSVILEVKRDYKGKVYQELPEFELGFGVGLDDFAVGDFVELTFSMSGKKINEHFHKTVAKAIYIKHGDISNDDTTTVGGESSDDRRIREKRDKEAQKEVFVAPNPADDPEDDGLPF